MLLNNTLQTCTQLNKLPSFISQINVTYFNDFCSSNCCPPKCFRWRWHIVTKCLDPPKGTKITSEAVLSERTFTSAQRFLDWQLDGGGRRWGILGIQDNRQDPALEESVDEGHVVMSHTESEDRSYSRKWKSVRACVRQWMYTTAAGILFIISAILEGLS